MVGSPASDSQLTASEPASKPALIGQRFHSRLPTYYSLDAFLELAGNPIDTNRHHSRCVLVCTPYGNIDLLGLGQIR